MSVLLHWGEKENEVLNKEHFLFFSRFKEAFTTEKICSECAIFDHKKQKCTHPALGCETNELRNRPWEQDVICPLKLKL